MLEGGHETLLAVEHGHALTSRWHLRQRQEANGYRQKKAVSIHGEKLAALTLHLPGRREYNTREREISAGVGGF